MKKKLKHQQVRSIVKELGESKVLDLDRSVKDLISPIGESLSGIDNTDELGLTILCCDNYVLVTGVVGQEMIGIEKLSKGISSAIKGN